MKKLLLPLVIVAAFLMQSCSTVAVTGRKQLNLVSDSEVLTASLTQYSDYMKTAKKSTNSKQTAQVVRVGKKIAAATEKYLTDNGMSNELKNFSWEFSLVQSDEVNAFCMPGGKIVVYEGIMDLISSDDELAVVMGHEVAHVVAKQLGELQKRCTGWTLCAFSADMGFERMYGRLASRRRRYYNGRIECEYHIFEPGKPPAGSNRQKKTENGKKPFNKKK